MERRVLLTLTLLLLGLAQGQTGPIPAPDDPLVVDKRELGDPPAVFNPYGFYPSSGIGIKPLRPFLPPGFFMNRFATTSPPPLDPMASFFKAKKDEFLNKLFDDLTVATEATPSIEVRSIVDTSLPDPDSIPSTTPVPVVDPSVFIAKKFDFLTQLFKTLNTTTVATPTIEPTDPSATTIKPTIVPPGFWAPFPKPPKPPKATKPPKPEKTKTLLLNAIDEGLLKSILAGVDPANPALQTRQAPVATREVTFLDKFLHRLTDEPPTEAPADSTLDTRSLMFPPGYWIPPYIYAAKMGIYLDKIFDTIDEAATTDDESDPVKRSAGDPSSLIMTELTSLKNDMMAAYLEGIKSAASTAAKPTPKTPKKPMWGPKPTVPPNPTEEKVQLLSDVFDKLAEVQQQLLGGPAPNATSSAATTPAPPTPDYWAPDPTAVDIAEYYKTKTQDFLSNIFASKLVPTPPDDK